MRGRTGSVLVGSLLAALAVALPAQAKTIEVKNVPDSDHGYMDDDRFVGWKYPTDQWLAVYDTLGRGFLEHEFSSCSQTLDLHEGEILVTRAPRTFPTFVPGVSDRCNRLYVKDLDSEEEERLVYEYPDDPDQRFGYSWLADDWLVGEYYERYPGSAPADPGRWGVVARHLSTGEERTYVYEQVRDQGRILDVDDNRVLFQIHDGIDTPSRTLHIDLDANRVTELPPAEKQVFLGLDGTYVLGFKGRTLSLFPAPGVTGARTRRVARGSYDGGGSVNGGVVTWVDYVGRGRRQRAVVRTRSVRGGRTKVVASRRRGKRPFARGDFESTMPTRYGVMWHVVNNVGSGPTKFTFPRP